MKTYFHVAVITALITGLLAAPSRAQTAPAADTAATPAPAASPAPAATPTATAPATPPASASTDKAGASDKTTASESSTAQTKKRTRMTTRQQIEHSLKTGTVPARYRSRVPKQYQRYIPFEK